VLLTNYLGLRAQSFVEDRTFDDEVWNQPLRGYRVTSQKEVSPVEANRLLDVRDADGSTPPTYVFNPRAKRLYHVMAEVDYIDESPSTTDGNLSKRIDDYVRTDKLEYVLELSGSGKITGGEWVGESKRHHPDFIWLPTRVSRRGAAGGLIDAAQVWRLHTSSIIGTTETTVVSETRVIGKDQWQLFGPYDLSGKAKLAATLSGSGDADLYVRFGAAPTAVSWDCRPYLSGSNEVCTFEPPPAGPVYVAVNGYASTSSYTLLVTID
jgi:hypothetical protein